MEVISPYNYLYYFDGSNFISFQINIRLNVFLSQNQKRTDEDYKSIISITVVVNWSAKSTKMKKFIFFVNSTSFARQVCRTWSFGRL